MSIHSQTITNIAETQLLHAVYKYLTTLNFLLIE